jgi:hypothetical protein
MIMAVFRFRFRVWLMLVLVFVAGTANYSKGRKERRKERSK